MRSIVNVGLPIYYGNNDTSVCPDIENTLKAINFPRIKWNIVCHNLRDGKRTGAPLRDLPHYFGQVGELHARLEQCEFQLIINESKVDPLQISISHLCKISKIREIAHLALY